MDAHHPTKRRVARDAARTATAFAAAMLALSAWVVVDDEVTEAAAAATADTARVVVPKGLPGADQPLTGGGSATPFALALPEGAACSSDSATGGYRIQTYLVPSSVDPLTLTFDADGPETGLPLFDTAGTPVVQRNTDIGNGNISGLPAFDFAVFGADGPTVIPPGTYHAGIACTVGTSSPTQLDKVWDVQLTFSSDPADEPSGITFTVAQSTTTTTTTAPSTTTSSTTSSTSSTTKPTTTTTAPTTTTTAKATTTTGPTTSTTRASTTTSTSSGASTTTSSSTTAPGDTTTTTLADLVLGTGASSGGSPFGGTSTGSGFAGGITSLPVTGGSISLLVWAALLVVFGRMAVLLGRAPEVRPTSGG